ncbi:MAG: aminotransferase class IV, partial [Pseudomonadota bacterium]
EHVFPGVCRPRVLAMLMSNVPPSERLLSEGLHLVSVEDIRWRACYIKANSLLANVLAREHARTLDADEALLHRDGCALEGATSNILAWIDNTLVSPPDGPDILPGVTRDWVLEQAAQAGIACERREIPLDALRRADEVWITSTNREVLAVTRLDDQPIGGGVPGDHWRGAWARYRASVT